MHRVTPSSFSHAARNIEREKTMILKGGATYCLCCQKLCETVVKRRHSPGGGDRLTVDSSTRARLLCWGGRELSRELRDPERENLR